MRTSTLFFALFALVAFMAVTVVADEEFLPPVEFETTLPPFEETTAPPEEETTAAPVETTAAPIETTSAPEETTTAAPIATSTSTSSEESSSSSSSSSSSAASTSSTVTETQNTNDDDSTNEDSTNDEDSTNEDTASSTETPIVSFAPAGKETKAVLTFSGVISQDDAQSAIAGFLNVSTSRIVINNVSTSKRQSNTVVDFTISDSKEDGGVSSVLLMKQLKDALADPTTKIGGLSATIEVVSVNYDAEYTFTSSTATIKTQQSSSSVLSATVFATATLALVLAF